jgi:putative endonuclease
VLALDWKRWFGDAGERAAARHLRRSGLRILAWNYQTNRGEIDLIARERDVLVFVEVKSRSWGSPAEAVDRRKQERLTRAAAEFLRVHGLYEVSSRFDVVAVVWPQGVRRPEVEHIRGAFEATGNVGFA